MHSTNTKDMKLLFESWRCHNTKILKESDDPTWGGAAQWAPVDRMRMFGEAFHNGEVQVLVDATGEIDEIFFGLGDDIWTIDADGVPAPRPFGDNPANIMSPDEVRDYLRNLPDFDETSDAGRKILNTIGEIEQRAWDAIPTPDELAEITGSGRSMRVRFTEYWAEQMKSTKERWSNLFTKLRNYWTHDEILARLRKNLIAQNYWTKKDPGKIKIAPGEVPERHHALYADEGRLAVDDPDKPKGKLMDNLDQFETGVPDDQVDDQIKGYEESSAKANKKEKELLDKANKAQGQGKEKKADKLREKAKLEKDKASLFDSLVSDLKKMDRRKYRTVGEHIGRTLTYIAHGTRWLGRKYAEKAGTPGKVFAGAMGVIATGAVAYKMWEMRQYIGEAGDEFLMAIAMVTEEDPTGLMAENIVFFLEAQAKLAVLKYNRCGPFKIIGGVVRGSEPWKGRPVGTEQPYYEVNPETGEREPQGHLGPMLRKKRDEPGSDERIASGGTLTDMEGNRTIYGACGNMLSLTPMEQIYVKSLNRYNEQVLRDRKMTLQKAADEEARAGEKLDRRPPEGYKSSVPSTLSRMKADTGGQPLEENRSSKSLKIILG